MSQAENVRVASPAKVSKPLSSPSPSSSPMVLNSEVKVPAPFTICRSVDTSTPVVGRFVPRTIPSVFNIKCESTATTTSSPAAAPRSNIPVAIQQLCATPFRYGATTSLSDVNYTHRPLSVPQIRKVTEATLQSADTGTITCNSEATLPELRRQRAAINPTPAVGSSSTASLGTPSTSQLPRLPSSGIRHSRTLATALSDLNYEQMEIASSPIVLIRRSENFPSRAGKDHISSVSLPSRDGITIADFSAPLTTNRPSTSDQELQTVMDKASAICNVGSPIIDVLHHSALKVGDEEQSWITQQVPETAFSREATFTSLVSAPTTSSFQKVELRQNVVPEPEYMVSLRAMAATPCTPSTGTVFQFRGVGPAGPANFRSCHSGSGSNRSVVNYRKKVNGKAKGFQHPLLNSNAVGKFGAPTRVDGSTLAFSPSTLPSTTMLRETTPNFQDRLSKGSLETTIFLPSVPRDLTMDFEGTIKEVFDWEERELHKEQAATRLSGMHSQKPAVVRGVLQATTPTCQPHIKTANLDGKLLSPLKREKSRVFSAQYTKIPGTDRVATVTRTPAEVFTIHKRGEPKLVAGLNRMRSCTNPLRLADNPILWESSHRREAPTLASARRSQTRFSRMAPSIFSNSGLQTQVKDVFGETAGSHHSPNCMSFHTAASPRHSIVVSSAVFARRLSHFAISSSSPAAQRLPSPLVVPSCEIAGRLHHSPLFLPHGPCQLPKVENVHPSDELCKKPSIVIAPRKAGFPTIERPIVTPLPTAKNTVSAFDVTPPKMTWVERTTSWGSKLRERVQTAEEQAKQRARLMRKKREIQSVAVHSPSDGVQVTRPPFRHSRLFSGCLKFEGYSKTQKPEKWTSIVQAKPLENDVFDPSSSLSDVARCSGLREGNTPAQLTPAKTRMSLESPRGERKERTRKRSWVVGQERVREMFRRAKKEKRN